MSVPRLESVLVFARLSVTMAALACAGGCSWAGREIDPVDVSLLRLRETTPQTAKQLFGEPASGASRQDESGQFEIQRYWYAFYGPIRTDFRSLVLEFRNEKLNGWICASTFEDDVTRADATAVAGIRSGESRKADVERILGRAAGRVLIPSSFDELVQASRRAEAAEAQCWADLRNHQSIIVVYDKSGTVLSVVTRQWSGWQYGW